MEDKRFFQLLPGKIIFRDFRNQLIINEIIEDCWGVIMQVSSLSRWKKYVLSLFLVILLVSVGLNLYNFFFIQPSLQAASNNKDNQAFEDWTHFMYFIADLLEKARTNLEVEDAWTLSRIWGGTSAIFISSLESAGGPARDLGFEVGFAMMWLTESTDAIYIGNQTSLALRELEPAVLVKIGNLTAAMRVIPGESDVELLHDSYGSLSQWLSEKNLINPLINNCKQIQNIGQDIYKYYYG